MLGRQTTKKILIIDDDENACKSLSFFLDRNGYETFTAGNAEQGLELFHASNPSLVLLDVLLPTTDGFEVCKQIKATSIGRQVPVVLMSAYYSPESISAEAQDNYGAADYLVKPLSASRLISLVESLTAEPQISADTMGASLSGDLKHLSFAALMGLLYCRKSTGVLALSPGDIEHSIYFIDGSPVYIHYIQSELDEALDSRQNLPLEELARQLQVDICNKLLNCFSFTEGRYSFTNTLDFIEDVPIFEIDIENLVFKGVYEHFPPARFKPLMALIGDWRLQKEKEFEEIISILNVDRQGKALMGIINGKLNIKDLLVLNPEHRTYNFALIYTLIVLGAIGGKAN
jgi:CheY-like chemotaxis protein